MKAADRQASDKVRALSGANDAQAIGLVLIAGELGEELVVGDPGAGGQLGFGADFLADKLGDAGGRADAEPVFGDIEIGLIKA